MTVTEIIKGLEKELHHADYHDLDYEDNVPVSLLKNAYTLIINQQAEIEICSEVIERQDKEIEELNRFANERLDKFTERYDRNLRAEAIKVFAEKLKEYKCSYDLDNYHSFEAIDVDDIDEVIKEMIGEQE